MELQTAYNAITNVAHVKIQLQTALLVVEIIEILINLIARNNEILFFILIKIRCSTGYFDNGVANCVECNYKCSTC